MIPEYEQRLDEVFCEAFDTNHPAMLDWANIKMELKRLRANKDIALASYVKGLNER